MPPEGGRHRILAVHLEHLLALTLPFPRIDVPAADVHGGERVKAFVWEYGVMRNLNRLLGPAFDDSVTLARHINDRGQIVGDLIERGTGRRIPFVATPRPAEWAGGRTRSAAGARPPISSTRGDFRSQVRAAPGDSGNQRCFQGNWGRYRNHPSSGIRGFRVVRRAESGGFNPAVAGVAVVVDAVLLL